MERYRVVRDVGHYYVTFTVVEWLPVFIDETACKIIMTVVKYLLTALWEGREGRTGLE